ncbi:MAG TPA: iron-sulfur cluster assembly protein [Ferruginibacter sp.]|nr:iron-sulfur cluster assembly protein [Ferruginibacter sp.]
MELEITDPHYKEKCNMLQTLYSVIDPELMVNIVDLGLIYDIQLPDDQTIHITMTLTTPHCPMGATLQEMATRAVQQYAPGKTVETHITFDPPWSADCMTEEGKRQLNASF